jgi:hypothetical protein
MTWMRVTFSAQQIAAYTYMELEKRFFVEYAAAGTPTAAMMYGPWKPCDTGDYFFTPAAGRLAGALLQQYGGVPCPVPDVERLALLVGLAVGRETH